MELDAYHNIMLLSTIIHYVVQSVNFMQLRR